MMSPSATLLFNEESVKYKGESDILQSRAAQGNCCGSAKRAMALPICPLLSQVIISIAIFFFCLTWLLTILDLTVILAIFDKGKKQQSPNAALNAHPLYQ